MWRALLLAFCLALGGFSSVPACAEEDSNGCYWDGGANGIGHTFVVTPDGVIDYTS